MKKNPWIVFAIFSALFFSIQSTHFTYSISDENTYVLMAKAISEGELPYKDFFLAHPPLHILFLSAIYKVFGFTFVIFKATGPLFAIGSALLIFKLLLEKESPGAAIASCILFYFSYDLQRFSTFAVWITMAGFLVTLSVYLLLSRKENLSGPVMALAALSGFLSLIAGAACAGYLFFTERKNFVKFTIWFAGIFIGANILLIVLFSQSYVESAFTYHLNKPGEGNAKGDILWSFAKSNILLVSSLALFIFSSRKMRHIFLLPLAIIASYFLIIGMSMSKIYGYYLLFFIPWMALLGGKAISDVSNRLQDSLNTNKTAMVVAGVMILLLVGYMSAKSVHNYYENDFQDFDKADEIAKFVMQNSASDEHIFGDDSITPLVAILSSRKVMGNNIDSNSQRWRSGLSDLNETMRQLKEGGAKIVIDRKLSDKKGSLNYGLSFTDEYRAFLSKCKKLANFSSPWRGYTKEYFILDCT